jgi:hypothetical protein
MGLVRILLIFAVIYFAMKLFRMFVVPFIFRKATDKMKENMESRMRDQQAQADPRAEGEVRVETKAKPTSDRVEEGDYVEFEEVE